jgi:hypothetical protein
MKIHSQVNEAAYLDTTHGQIGIILFRLSVGLDPHNASDAILRFGLTFYQNLETLHKLEEHVKI